MALGRFITCPECEGTRLMVNYFDLPVSVVCPPIPIFITNEIRNSKGYLYTEHPCNFCEGKGFIIGDF